MQMCNSWMVRLQLLFLFSEFKMFTSLWIFHRNDFFFFRCVRADVTFWITHFMQDKKVWSVSLGGALWLAMFLPPRFLPERTLIYLQLSRVRGVWFSHPALLTQGSLTVTYVRKGMRKILPVCVNSSTFLCIRGNQFHLEEYVITMNAYLLITEWFYQTISLVRFASIFFIFIIMV